MGRKRPPKGTFQKGMEGKAIRAEKTSKARLSRATDKWTFV